MRAAIDGFLSGSGVGTRMRHAAVYDAWREVIGPAMTRRAKPVRFDKGELVVEVDSAAHMHELEGFTGENHRRAANARMGVERIRRVTFRLKH
jgi:hypothetical protein